MAEINMDELSEEQKEKIMGNAEVRKMIEYSEQSLPEVSELLEDFVPEDEDEDDSTYELYTEGVADRSGRVTQASVKKVINGMIEEGRSGQ